MVNQIFDYFSQINKVPRPSKHEEAMIEFLKEFAKNNGLGCKVDAAGNVLISKPASPGCESKDGVVLQAHMDMVCEKLKDLAFDFMTMPIQAYEDGDWLRAKGTTLGADDGIGVAMAMAALTDESLKHGPLECLFTRDEETGLTGAFAIEPGFMTGKYLINLDSEDEGEIFVGCAGGANSDIKFTFDREAVPQGFIVLKVGIDGLQGGHSGDDINKNRANANKLLVRFLSKVWNKYDARLISISGGNLHNAIPRDAEATFAVPMAEKENVRVDFNVFAAEVADEFHVEERNIHCNLESDSANTSDAIDQKSARNIIWALQAVHNGVLEMNQDIKGLVETSSNLASIRTDGNTLKIVTSQRSSTASSLKNVCNTVAASFQLAGAEVAVADGYPGWKPNMDSHLLKVATATYRELFGKEPVVRAIHAGLECGLFSEKYPGLDMISIGPTLRGVHSPDECLLIPTVEMVWKHMVRILEEL